MTSFARFERTPGLEAKDLGDEFLVYGVGPTGEGRVHVLNGTAREVFLACDGTRTAEDLAGELASRYDVEPGRALEDVTRLLERLEELGLVTR